MKRNIERINQLADRIEECEEVDEMDHQRSMGPSFTMSDVAYPCGSPACIMGHAKDMLGVLARASDELLAKDLGISVLQATELSAPDHEYADYGLVAGDFGFITKDHAVAVLRYLAATGEVDWKIGKSPSQGHMIS